MRLVILMLLPVIGALFWYGMYLLGGWRLLTEIAMISVASFCGIYAAGRLALGSGPHLEDEE